MTKKNVKLRIRSVQISGNDSSEDTIEILTDAILSEHGGKTSLEYKELLSEDRIPTETSLVFDKEKPDTIFLCRKGDVKMNCVIEKKERYRFSYNLGFAAIELICVGKDVRNGISEGKGELDLEYDIEARGATVQSCSLKRAII